MSQIANSATKAVQKVKGATNNFALRNGEDNTSNREKPSNELARQ
jgi:hypothetical protein